MIPPSNHIQLRRVNQSVTNEATAMDHTNIHFYACHDKLNDIKIFTSRSHKHITHYVPLICPHNHILLRILSSGPKAT